MKLVETPIVVKVDGAAEFPGVEDLGREWSASLEHLYEDARRTISAWCREADQAAKSMLESAEDTRAQAVTDAKRIREEARMEAGRILAAAEVHAGQIRSQAQMMAAESQADVEMLRARVDNMSSAVDQLLGSLEGVMSAVGSMAKPSRPLPSSRPAELEAAAFNGSPEESLQD